MAKQVTDIKLFVQYLKRKDAKAVKVIKSGSTTKFKIRTSRYLYTLKVNDKEKAEKISQAFPPGLEKIYIKK